MKKESRFDGLLRQAAAGASGSTRNPDPDSEQESKHLDIQTSKHSDVHNKEPTPGHPDTLSAEADSNIQTSKHLEDEEELVYEHPDVQTSKHLDTQKAEPASKHLNIQTSKHPDKAKSKDPDFVRTTVYLPRALHRQLKNFATNQDSEMSEVMIEAVQAYLTSRHPDV